MVMFSVILASPSVLPLYLAAVFWNAWNNLTQEKRSAIADLFTIAFAPRSFQPIASVSGL
jgi:hypothetical protein